MSQRYQNNEKQISWFQSLFRTARTFLAVVAFGTLCATAPARADEDGPYADISEADASALGQGDAGFKNIFASLQRMDNSTQSAIYIPSGRPVDKLVALTSSFGVRSDPFNGHARMHKGIDIPGAIGTPIYATADGVVSRAGWANGYGNLVEISHGNGMQTRYGHMSKLIVAPNTRVRRGQIIGLMGSTGRSTGSHLHYEVRVDGTAVNPLPFVAGSEYLIALNTKPPVAMGGPTSKEEKDADY